MPTRKPFIAASLASILTLAPFPSDAQSLSDLLRFVPGRDTSALVGAIKSLTEITQGQVAPGTEPGSTDGKVVLYRTAWCGYCKRAASYMQQKNVPFVERDIEKNSDYRAEYSRLGGKGGIPMILFGDKIMSGFNEQAFDDNLRVFRQSVNSPAPSVSAAGTPTSAGAVVRSGDILVGKIAGIGVYSQPMKSGEKFAVVGKTDEVIYMGEERDGFYRVTTPKGEGWIDKLLLKKQ